MDFINEVLIRLQNNSQLVTYFIIAILALNLFLLILLFNKKSKISALIKNTFFFCLLAVIFSTPVGRVFWLNGWGWHDWFLFANIGLLLISTCLVLIKKRRFFAYVNLFYFLIVLPFIMVIFFGIGRSVTIKPSYFYDVWFLDKQSQIVVQQIEKNVVEGRSRGVTHSSSSDLVVAVDSRNGQFKWSKPMDNREYLIGKLGDNALFVNQDDRTIYLLDINSGKIIQTENELAKIYPKLKDNFSYRYSDYRVSSPDEWYMHGTDDKYYQIDGKTKQVTENARYQEMFSWPSLRRPGEMSPAEQLLQQLNQTFPQMLELSLVYTKDFHHPVVIFKNRLDDIGYQLARVDAAQSKIIWQKDMTTDDDDDVETDIHVYGINNNHQLLFIHQGYLYAVNENSGETTYRYNFKWNQIQPERFFSPF